MDHNYPVYLNLAGRLCIVIGGGKVAERKVQSLLACDANVKVISPTVSQFLLTAASLGKIQLVLREYSCNDIDNAFLVISATANNQVNQQVADDCLHQNKLVNVVDDPAKCNFIVPAVFRRGALSIAISTNGKSPTLARKIKKELMGHYGPEYAELLDLLGEMRGKVITGVQDMKRRRLIFEQMVNADLLDLLRKGEKEKVKERIEDVLGGSRVES
ncbi:MAG: bifunctional precorrin-2 dehydrogenase/sirohydrochlorin ferrochelatase [Carboxydocellales bacterium]